KAVEVLTKIHAKEFCLLRHESVFRYQVDIRERPKIFSHELGHMGLVIGPGANHSYSGPTVTESENSSPDILAQWPWLDQGKVRLRHRNGEIVCSGPEGEPTSYTL